jgi:hypothetical protein
MPATYATRVIDASEIPTAADSAYQHVLEVYASEINKTASVWRAFDDRRPIGQLSVTLWWNAGRIEAYGLGINSVPLTAKAALDDQMA